MLNIVLKKYNKDFVHKANGEKKRSNQEVASPSSSCFDSILCDLDFDKSATGEGNYSNRVTSTSNF